MHGWYRTGTTRSFTENERSIGLFWGLMKFSLALLYYSIGLFWGLMKVSLALLAIVLQGITQTRTANHKLNKQTGLKLKCVH